MNRTIVIAVCLVLATAAVPVLTQQASCTPEPARRSAALRIARSINTSLARGFGTTKQYPVFQSVVPADTSGFTVRGLVSADGDIFSVREGTTSPCAFALFSDDSGLIFEGAPLR